MKSNMSASWIVKYRRIHEAVMCSDAADIVAEDIGNYFKFIQKLMKPHGFKGKFVIKENFKQVEKNKFISKICDSYPSFLVIPA